MFDGTLDMYYTNPVELELKDYKKSVYVLVTLPSTEGTQIYVKKGIQETSNIWNDLTCKWLIMGIPVF